MPGGSSSTCCFIGRKEKGHVQLLGSDTAIPLNDTTDYDSSDIQNEEEEEGDDNGEKDLSSGDMVIVNIPSLTRWTGGEG